MIETTPDIIPLEIIKRHRIIPLERNQQGLRVGMVNPDNHDTNTLLRFITGLPIQSTKITEEDVKKYIGRLNQSAYSKLEANIAKSIPIEEPTTTPLDLIDAPVIEYVNHLLNDAIAKKISDIHIEPYAENCRIRFRRDGLLYEAASIPTLLAGSIATRLKIMAELNIAERRLPQDGRIHWHEASNIDIRMNTCPTLHGEKIVLRILDSTAMPLDISALGFLPAQLSAAKEAFSRPHGLVLVTGPTGSGKTLTLYSALQSLNCQVKNITTVEDPIEIELPGINQLNVNPKINLTFASALRTLLRQDPDVIMVGEIRDHDTATMAVQAAHTGHLVLSTLHTNNAIDALWRMQAIGIPSYNLITSITLIIAQRLLRILCPHCKQSRPLPNYLERLLEQTHSFQAIGCDHCHQGYLGRTGVFECINIHDDMAAAVVSGADANRLNEIAASKGDVSMWQSGLEKVRSGMTSYDELLRVIPAPTI